MTEIIEPALGLDQGLGLKKKGRPRKNPIPEPDTELLGEKKKRGRKKKEKIEEEEIKPKKKRGRKASIKYFSSSIRKKIPLTTMIYDNDNSVLHLDIKEQNIENKITYDTLPGTSVMRQGTSIENLENNQNDENLDGNKDDLVEYINKHLNIDNTEKLNELYEKRLESRLLQDTKSVQVIDELKKVKKNTDNTSDTVTDTNNKNNGFINILSDFIDTNNWNTTNIACWWCCHTFDSIPLGLPVDYYKKKFRVKGLYCSFACMIAYGKNNNLYNAKIKSMVISLYKKLTGCTTINMINHKGTEDCKNNYKNLISSDCVNKNLFKGDLKLQNDYIDSLMSFIDVELQPAPNKCVLKMFGGNLSIQDFRNSTRERKIYKMIEYPMFVSRDYIEEIDINNLKNVNKNVFTKQQNIPLANNLDENKLNEAKTRIDSNVIVTKTGMDKFITW